MSVYVVLASKCFLRVFYQLYHFVSRSTIPSAVSYGKVIDVAYLMKTFQWVDYILLVISVACEQYNFTAIVCEGIVSQGCSATRIRISLMLN